MNFAAGVAAGVGLNVPNYFMEGKMAEKAYAQTFKETFTSVEGLKKFRGHTMLWAPFNGLHAAVGMGEIGRASCRERV